MSGPKPVQPQDSELDPPQRRYTVWSFAWNVALQLLIFFVLYTLSIGPMYWRWYAGRNLEPASPVAAFYHPLYRLAEWNDAFGEFMNWYVDLWIG